MQVRARLRHLTLEALAANTKQGKMAAKQLEQADQAMVVYGSLQQRRLKLEGQGPPGVETEDEYRYRSEAARLRKEAAQRTVIATETVLAQAHVRMLTIALFKQPKYLSDHSDIYLLSLSKKVFSGSKYA